MARQLVENVERIRQLTDRVCNARTAHMLAEADYMDAQAEEYSKALISMSATAAEKMSKIKTLKQWKHREEARVFLQNSQDLLRVLETDNANLKMAIRLMNIETNNLNL